MKRKPKNVILFEDDVYLAETIKGHIEDLGASCMCFSDVESGEHSFTDKNLSPTLIIADRAIPFEGTKLFDLASMSGGWSSGIQLLRLARKKWAKATLALITGHPSEEAAAWCAENGVNYATKPIDRGAIEKWMELRRLRAFVVHGRNLAHVEKIKKALINLNIEPIVLFEQPSKGRTVIEKFEAVAGVCDLAIIALSPDDLGRLEGKANDAARARQNVIFELGYFCASLGRRAGKVVLVDFGGVEIPSDLAGVIYINGMSRIDGLIKALKTELT